VWNGSEPSDDARLLHITEYDVGALARRERSDAVGDTEDACPANRCQFDRAGRVESRRIAAVRFRQSRRRAGLTERVVAARTRSLIGTETDSPAVFVILDNRRDDAVYRRDRRGAPNHPDAGLGEALALASSYRPVQVGGEQVFTEEAFVVQHANRR